MCENSKSNNFKIGEEYLLVAVDKRVGFGPKSNEDE
jgi:hypothetical protein